MHVSCLYLWNRRWLGLKAKVQRTYGLILVANPYGKTTWYWTGDGGTITQTRSQDPPNFLFACLWYLHDELITLQFKSLYFLKCYFLHNSYLKIAAKRFSHIIDSFLVMNNKFTFSQCLYSDAVIEYYPGLCGDIRWLKNPYLYMIETKTDHRLVNFGYLCISEWPASCFWLLWRWPRLCLLEAK